MYMTPEQFADLFGRAGRNVPLYEFSVRSSCGRRSAVCLRAYRPWRGSPSRCISPADERARSSRWGCAVARGERGRAPYPRYDQTLESILGTPVGGD
jgi:hypothetical protein